VAAWGTVGRSSEQHGVRKPRRRRASNSSTAASPARREELPRGLAGAGASSSPVASSAHVRATAPPRPRGHACEQLRGEGGRGGGSPAGELAWGAAAPASWA